MKKLLEYCCNKLMPLVDQLLVRDREFQSILTLYQCVNCKQYRGWLIREVEPKVWSEPRKIKSKDIAPYLKAVITNLFNKETRAVTYVSEGTLRMSKNTIQ